MPKPRTDKAASGHSNYFAVSPWQDKSEKPSEGADVGAAPAEYSEVELDLVVSGSGSGGGGLHPAHADGMAAVAMVVEAEILEGAAPTVAQAGQPAVAEALPAVQAAAAAAAAASPAPPEGEGWHAKKRKIAEDEDGQGLEAMPARGAPGVGSYAAAEEQQQQQQQQAAHEGQVELEGTAYVALLPNGNITGHLVCSPSAFTRRRSIGLMGEVVVAGRECTRDADWGVLRMTLIHFAAGEQGGSRGGGHEVSFLVERTDGDAMTLRAPVPWQGLEMEDLPSLDATCSASSSSGLTLTFRCEQLLTGPAGEAVLQRLQPSLAGRGALLNVGQMHVVLPGEAAAELLGGAQQGPQRVQHGSPAQRQATPPLGRQQPAQQQQRRVTGQGSGGSGRVVRDTADDW